MRVVRRSVVARVVCSAYWLLLTMLLLVPHPAAWVGMRSVPNFPWGKFGIHLTAFTLLALLVNATRWPKRLWWPLLVFLVLYGVTTEWLQNFVPPRTARVMDAVENILGIAAGSGIYWLILWLRQPAMDDNLPSELVRYAVEAETAAE